MATSGERPRDPGRPRQFTDDVAFRATAEAVALNGYRGLTMTSVAKIVGCTGPALIHRFGSKQGLLLGYLEWSIERSEQLFSKAREDFDSPLAALRSRFADPDHRHTSDDAAHSAHVVFFVEGRIDAAFVPQMERYAQSLTTGIEQLLGEATQRGELTETDIPELGRIVIAAVIGASLMWTPVRETPLAESVGQMIDSVIAPYRAA